VAEGVAHREEEELQSEEGSASREIARTMRGMMMYLGPPIRRVFTTGAVF
jgi:hypothetical protein